MKLSINTLITTLAMTAAFSGCNKSSGSNNVTTNFSVTGSRQDVLVQNNFQKAFSLIIPTAVALPPAALEDKTGAAVNLSKAWIVLKKIQFKTGQVEESGESSITSSNYKGPFFIDLLSPDPVPFGDISLPEKGLRRVKMLLHKDSSIPASAPAELNGNSIFLKGVVRSFDFTFAADETTDIQISGPKAVVPEEGKDLLATIRIAHLFKKIDLSDIIANTNISSLNRVLASNRCPEIHPGANDLYTCFRKGIAQEAKFGKDAVGDHDLDANDDVVNE